MDSSSSVMLDSESSNLGGEEKKTTVNIKGLRSIGETICGRIHGTHSVKTNKIIKSRLYHW